MSDDQQPERAGKRPYFRPKAIRNPLSPEALDRQSELARFATATLGAAECVTFLNQHDDELGGRPIDLVIADAEGLSAIKAALTRRQEKQRPTDTHGGQHEASRPPYDA